MTNGAGHFTFVDTSAFFGLFNTSDYWHQMAVQVHMRIVAERWRLVTSNWIIAETHALMLSKLGRDRALAMLDQFDADAQTGDLTVVRVEPGDETRAREIIRQYDDKDFSLVDASSFALTDRPKIASVFTFDRHFEQYGLAVLTP